MVLCIQDNEGDAFCVCKLLVQMKKNLIYMHHIQPMHNNICIITSAWPFDWLWYASSSEQTICSFKILDVGATGCSRSFSVKESNDLVIRVRNNTSYITFLLPVNVSSWSAKSHICTCIFRRNKAKDMDRGAHSFNCNR